MSGDEPGVVGITQRDLLLEMREDIRGLTDPRHPAHPWLPRDDDGAGHATRAGRVTPTMPTASRAQIALVEAYVTTGSHKCAAERMHMGESAYRARVHRLCQRFGANGMTQLAYMLRDQLPPGLTATTETLAG